MNILYSLQHLGYTIPPQADAGWIGEAGPGPSLPRRGLGRAENDFTNRNTTFMTLEPASGRTAVKDASGSTARLTATSARSGMRAAGSTSPTRLRVRRSWFSTTRRFRATATRCGFCSPTSGSSTRRSRCSVVDRSNRKDVLGELNPGLRVPTLVLDDGRPLGESNAILWYLGDGTRVRARRRVRARSGPAVDVLRAVQPRAEHRRRALLARVLGNARALSGAAAGTHAGRICGARRDGGPSRGADVPRGRAVLDRRHRVVRVHARRATRGTSISAPYSAIRSWLERVASQPGHVPIDA